MFMKAERKKGAKLNEVKPIYIYVRSRIVSGGQYLVSLPLRQDISAAKPIVLLP